MPTLAHKLALLGRLGRRREAAALAVTLVHCAANEADMLAAPLLDLARHGSSGALLGVLEAWEKLQDTTRGHACRQCAAMMGSALEELASSPHPGSRRACAHACGFNLLHPGLAPGAVAVAADLLGDLVNDSEAPVAAAALDRLGEVVTATGSAHPPSLPAPALARLDAVLESALASFDIHRHAGIVKAALSVAHRQAGPRLRAFLQGADGPGHMALRGAARRVDASVGAERCVAWLGIPALAGVGREWIERGGAEAQSQLLSGAHLLGLRGRAGAIEKFGAQEKLLPSDSRLADLSSPLRRGSIRLARLVAKTDRRLLHLIGFLADPDPMTRLSAAVAMTHEPASHLSDDALVDFSMDAHPLVSECAAGALASAKAVQRRSILAPALHALLRSAHASTRRIAEEALAGFDPFHWNEGDRRWQNGVSARRAHARAPGEFAEQVRSLLADGSTREKLAALGVVERLGLCGQFENEAVVLSRGRDQRLAAKAVRVLSRVSSPPARNALREALVHPDPRVRSDAVEALARAMPAEADQALASWTREDAARVRGNVLRHLISRRVEGAIAELATMLADDRPGHRLAALWVAERTVRIEFLGRITEMVASDDDAQVRARARRCAQWLQAHAKAHWRLAPVASLRATSVPGRDDRADDIEPRPARREAAA